ncbi:hypothetical protein JW756_00915 [Candidatus Woesearchaeota archaeon]|nr:hypothetical protein [Candidatus Woesearchaeota archaeon]
MAQKVKLYNPHPGIGGALLPLPKPMKDIADKLNRKSMSLDKAIEMISQVAKKVGGQVAVVEEHKYIRFQIKEPNNYVHVYRLICYK